MVAGHFVSLASFLSFTWGLVKWPFNDLNNDLCPQYDLIAGWSFCIPDKLTFHSLFSIILSHQLTQQQRRPPHFNLQATPSWSLLLSSSSSSPASSTQLLSSADSETEALEIEALGALAPPTVLAHPRTVHSATASRTIRTQTSMDSEAEVCSEVLHLHLENKQRVLWISTKKNI